jgi:hypothetical protein
MAFTFPINFYGFYTHLRNINPSKNPFILYIYTCYTQPIRMGLIITIMFEMLVKLDSGPTK